MKNQKHHGKYKTFFDKRLRNFRSQKSSKHVEEPMGVESRPERGVSVSVMTKQDYTKLEKWRLDFLVLVVRQF